MLDAESGRTATTGCRTVGAYFATRLLCRYGSDYHDPYAYNAYAYGTEGGGYGDDDGGGGWGGGGGGGRNANHWQSAADQAMSQKKDYLNALTDMVGVAKQTSEQLFEILPCVSVARRVLVAAHCARLIAQSCPFSCALNLLSQLPLVCSPRRTTPIPPAVSKRCRYCQNDAAASELVLGLLSNSGFIQTEFTDARGNTLVNVAAQTRNETVARILLEDKHAKATAVNHDGASPLHFTCATGTTSVAITKLLLSRRANPNLRDHNFGCTPLHYAASCADEELAKMLLKYAGKRRRYRLACIHTHDVCAHTRTRRRSHSQH